MSQRRQKPRKSDKEKQADRRRAKWRAPQRLRQTAQKAQARPLRRMRLRVLPPDEATLTRQCIKMLQKTVWKEVHMRHRWPLSRSRALRSDARQMISQRGTITKANQQLMALDRET
jgi:hypothetical protein